MAKKDATTKLLTKDNDVFAELFNSFVFGKSVVDPKKLQEKDTSAIAMVFSKIAVREKFRDVLKHAELKTDDRFSYFLLGLERGCFVVLPQTCWFLLGGGFGLLASLGQSGSHLQTMAILSVTGSDFSKGRRSRG